MDSDSVADTVKSFFPVVDSSTEVSPSQDLRLSLHSFPDGPPSLFNYASTSVGEPVLFYGQSNPFGYTSTGCWEQQSVQRLVAWNSGDTGNGGGGFHVAQPPHHSTTSYGPVFGQSQLFSQRGSLQSSYTPMIRVWFDPHHHQSFSTDHLNHHIPPPVFASGEFSPTIHGFRVKRSSKTVIPSSVLFYFKLSTLEYILQGLSSSFHIESLAYTVRNRKGVLLVLYSMALKEAKKGTTTNKCGPQLQLLL